MTGIPLSKAKAALATVVALLEDRKSITEFSIRRARRDAEAALRTDPVHARVCLGALAALEWNDAELDHQHKLAIQLDDDDMTHGNYSISLQNVCRVFEAAEQARIASERQPGSLEMLEMAIGRTYAAGEFEHALELCKVYDQRSPSRPNPSASKIRGAVEVIRHRQITESLVRENLAAAYGLLRKHRVACDSVSIETFDEPGDYFVMYYIHVDETPEVIKVLENELTETVFDHLDEVDLSAFWVGFVPKEVEHAD